MKNFFDTNINIPAIKKAGKYLQKVKKVKDLSALVKSLDFCVVELTTQDDYMTALTSCHSCQSNSIAIKKFFFDTYSKISKIKFIGLIDKQGTIYARCLVNPRKCTYAPVYGQFHYMLQARLDYAGYRAGAIIEKKEIENLLKIEEQGSKFLKNEKLIFLKEDETRYQKTSIYLDSEKQFINRKIVVKSGYYTVDKFCEIFKNCHKTQKACINN